MYTLLFILIGIGSSLFHVASGTVKVEQKPLFSRNIIRKPLVLRTIGTSVFLIGWAAAINLLGFGSGTFAMLGYLMASFCVIVLLRPLHCINSTGFTVVGGAAFLLEVFIF